MGLLETHILKSLAGENISVAQSIQVGTNIQCKPDMRNGGISY